MDFHQIFMVCLTQKDLELFGEYRTKVAMATLLRFLGLKFVGVPQSKPMHGFSHFQVMLTETGSRAE